MSVTRIAVIGTGYVGLVTGTCLSDFGLSVTCVDRDTAKVERLRNGFCPIYEPGLEALIRKNLSSGRLSFTSDIEKAVMGNDVVIIAVGTPSKEDGAADVQYVLAAAAEIGRYINGHKVIVNKSTVPVGTGRNIIQTIGESLAEKGVSHEFDFVSNPEFLREGSAIHDFTHPDRVVIGTESQRAKDIMKQVYRVLYINETPFAETSIETAEMIKYASNAFLAMKVTFINEVANLCERVGADVQEVARAMGKDGRIGPKFLHPGPGYGGSCFPKDTRALVQMGVEHGAPVTLVEQTVTANEYQKQLMVAKIEQSMGTVQGKTLAVLGLSFKPNTDDMREAPSITIMEELSKRGATFRVYDPAAMEEAKSRLAHLSQTVTYCRNEYEALEGSDALVIITEWNQFRSLNLGKVRHLLKAPYFFDLRNIYDRIEMEQRGFRYTGVGQGS